MNVLTLPGSGKQFLCQLVALQHLCEVNYEPNLILGSSGGNLCSFIASAAQFKWQAVERIAKQLRSSFFAKPWHDFRPLSYSIGFFNGTAFTTGEGLPEFLATYFTKETINRYEIWTGTYNKDLQKFRLFCNKSKEESILKHCDMDYEVTQSMEPYFCNGNFELISKAGLASASIPGLVPAVKIDEYYYSDGVTAGASPLTLMQGVILKSTTNCLHITYINAKDLSKPNLLPHHNLFDTWKQAVNDLIKSQTLIDRLAAHELLQSKGYDIQFKSFDCTYTNLLDIMELKQTIKYSLLEVYPTISADFDITNFNSNDIERNLKLLYGTLKCHFWYIL